MDKLNKISIIGILVVTTLSLSMEAKANGAAPEPDYGLDAMFLPAAPAKVTPKPVKQAPQPLAKPVGSVFDGFYLGAGVNFIAATGKAKLDTGYYPDTTQPGTQKFPLSSYDLGLSGFGGYGKVFKQRFYLGGELFANYSPMDITGSKATNDFNLGYNERAEIKSDFALGGALRLGYLITDRAMLYALLGADYTRFKMTSSDIGQPDGSTWKSPGVNKDVVGFLPGIGMEVMLYKNLALRAQYTYALYPNFSDSYVRTLPSGVKENEKMQYDLARSTFTLGLDYHFAPPGTYNSISPIIYDTTKNSPFDGFYLGIGGDFVATTGDMKNASTNLTNNNTRTERYRISSYDLGITGLGGFGKTFKQRFYLGGELFAGYLPMESKSTSSGVFHDGVNAIQVDRTDAEVKSDYSYGGGLRLGYLVSPKVMAYVLAAADFTQFKAEAHDEKGVPFATYLNYTSPRLTKDVVGFMPGIGIEAMLYKNLSIRGQYTYSLYPSFTDSFTTKDNGDTYKHEVKYNLSRSIFMLALAYHF